MTPSIEAAAEALWAARRDLKPIPPLRETHGLGDPDDAYRVQDVNTVRRLAEGRRLVGRKIGLTSKAVQAQLGVDQPDYGVLWDDFAFSDGDTVATSRFMQPKVEAEVALVMARPVADPAASMTEVVAAVAYALPAVEIVDSAIADWAIGLADTIADNASGGGFALGLSPRKVTEVDLRLGGAVLSRNGRIASTGVGAACLGHPFNALLWLARKMAAIGRPLAEGDVVLSGALGPMVPAAAGDVFSIEIQGFAPLHLGFARV